MTNKDTNGKTQWTLVPLKLLKGIAKVRAYGNRKYKKDSWKDVKNGKQKYLDALMRHVEKIQSGEVLNPKDENLPHIDQVLTNAMFLRHFLDEDIKKAQKSLIEKVKDYIVPNFNSKQINYCEIPFDTLVRIPQTRANRKFTNYIRNQKK